MLISKHEAYTIMAAGHVVCTNYCNAVATALTLAHTGHKMYTRQMAIYCVQRANTRDAMECCWAYFYVSVTSDAKYIF